MLKNILWKFDLLLVSKKHKNINTSNSYFPIEI